MSTKYLLDSRLLSRVLVLLLSLLLGKEVTLVQVQGLTWLTMEDMSYTLCRTIAVASRTVAGILNNS